MNDSIKKSGIILLFGLLSIAAFSQSLTKQVAPNIEQIIIREGHGAFHIEGHGKPEIIITAKGINPNPKGKGMTPLFSGGTDTGLDLTINETSKEIELVGTSREYNQSYHILVPQNIAFKAEWKNHDSQKLLRISNLKSGLEIHRINGAMEITDITGPLVLYTMHGETKIRFSQIHHDHPISISSYNAEVEIELPAETKATLNMSSGRGEVFSDFEVKKIPSPKLPDKGRTINGTINGGGVKIILETWAGNFYLKKY